MKPGSDRPQVLPQSSVPPLTHRLVVSAQENKTLLSGATAVFFVVALTLDVWESGEPHAGWIVGSGFFFYLLGAMSLLGAFACWYQARIAQQEFSKIARGDYLAHWTYTRDEWEVFQSLESGDQEGKSKVIFYSLVVLFGLLGLASGILAAMNKSPLWAAFVGLPAGIAIGIAIWAVLILPFKILTNTYNRILVRRDLQREVIFTARGVYSTGRFFQVNDVGYESVASGTSNIDLPERSALARVVVLWIAVKRGSSIGTTSTSRIHRSEISHTQRYVVPEGQAGAAQALTKHYPPLTSRDSSRSGAGPAA